MYIPRWLALGYGAINSMTIFLVSRVCLEMNGFKLRVVRVFKLRSVDRLGSRVPRCCKMDVVLFFVTIVMVSG